MEFVGALHVQSFGRDVGFADDQSTRLAQPSDDGGLLRGRFGPGVEGGRKSFLQGRVAQGSGKTGDIDHFLDGDRDPGQAGQRQVGGGGGGGGGGVEVGDCLNDGVVRLVVEGKAVFEQFGGGLWVHIEEAN